MPGGFELPPVRQQITGDASGYVSAMAEAAAATGTLSTAAVAGAGALAGAGGLAVAAAEATREAAVLESQTAELAKLVGTRQADPLASSIQDLSNEMPVARSELMATAETAARLGIRGRENITEFTRVAAEIGTATDQGANEAANNFARILEVTNQSVDSFRNVAAATNALSNTAAASFSEINDATLRSSAALSQLGLRTEDILALNTSLIEVSSSARRAGTRLRNVGQTLQDPGRVDRIAKALGDTGDEFQRLLDEDPAAAIEMLVRAFERGGDTADRLAGVLNRRALQAIQGIAQNTEGLADAQRRANEQMREATSLTEEYERFLNTAASQQQILNNQIKNLQANMGEDLLPVWKDVLQVGQFWTTQLNEMVTGPLDTLLSDAQVEQLTKDLEDLAGTAQGGQFFQNSGIDQLKRDIAGFAQTVEDAEDRPEFFQRVQSLIDAMRRGADISRGEFNRAMAQAAADLNSTSEEADETADSVEGVGSAAQDAGRIMERAFEEAIDSQEVFQSQLDRTRQALVRVVQLENTLATPAGGGVPTHRQVDRFLRRTSPGGVRMPAATRNRGLPAGPLSQSQIAAEMRGGMGPVGQANAEAMQSALERVNDSRDREQRILDRIAGTLSSELNPALRELREEAPAVVAGLRAIVNALEAEFTPGGDQGGGLIGGLINLAGTVAAGKFGSSGAAASSGGGGSAPSHLASGGIAHAGMGVVVGEEGPELFFPGQTGRVVPNQQAEGGGGQTQLNVNFQIQALDAAGVERIIRERGAPAIVDVVRKAGQESTGLAMAINRGMA